MAEIFEVKDGIYIDYACTGIRKVESGWFVTDTGDKALRKIMEELVEKSKSVTFHGNYQRPGQDQASSCHDCPLSLHSIEIYSS